MISAGASYCFSAILGFEKCFLVDKLYQEIGGHMLTLKIGTIKVSGQSGQTGQTSCTNRSDRSGKFCQIINWTAPLRRSRRGDRNAYMEHPIWSLDEGVMPLGRPAPRSDRSDRSRAVRPVQRPVRPVRNAQSELGVVF